MLGSAAQANAHSLTLCDRHDEARLLFTAIGEGCQDNGDHFSVPLVLAQAAYLERRAGRWDRALELMKVGDRSAAGQGQPYRWQPASQAGLGGLRGDRERSVATLERLGPLLHSAGEANVEAIVLRLLGQIRLAHREDDQAWTTLARFPPDRGVPRPVRPGRCGHDRPGRVRPVHRATGRGRVLAPTSAGTGHGDGAPGERADRLQADRGRPSCRARRSRGRCGGIQAMLEAHDRGHVEATLRARRT